MDKQADELALKLYELATQFLAPFKDDALDAANPFGETGAADEWAALDSGNVEAVLSGNADDARPDAAAPVRAGQDGRPTFTQLRVLLAIQKGFNQVGVLARLGTISQPAVSKMVDGIVRLGLLRRDPHPEDRRQILLGLTEKGEAAVAAARFRAALRYVQAIRKLSESDRTKISEGIRVILEVIGASHKE